MKITNDQLRRIIREAISRSSCSPKSYSLAWISPQGKIHALTPGEDHDDWADKYADKLYKDVIEIDDDRLDNDPDYEEIVEKHYDWKTETWDESYLSSHPEVAAYLSMPRGVDGPVGWLISQGWVKMTNGFMFTAYPVEKLDDRAVSAIVDLVINCTIVSGIDPEIEKMFIEEFSDNELMPSDEFLTPEYSERLKGGSGYFGSQHLIGADSVRQPIVSDFIQDYGTDNQQKKLYSSLT